MLPHSGLPYRRHHCNLSCDHRFSSFDHRVIHLSWRSNRIEDLTTIKGFYHPNVLKGQIYIGVVNWILCAITLERCLLLQNIWTPWKPLMDWQSRWQCWWRHSLLFEYIRGRWSTPLALTCLLFFGTIETIFFISSLVKFVHGGYVTALITAVLIFIHGNLVLR